MYFRVKKCLKLTYLPVKGCFPFTPPVKLSKYAYISMFTSLDLLAMAKTLLKHNLMI